MTSYNICFIVLLTSLAVALGAKYTTKYLPPVIDDIDTDSAYLIADPTDNYQIKQTYDKSRQFYQTANIMPNLPLPLYFLDRNQQSKKSQSKKKLKESSIFYIRLPPTPYMMVPGLGFVSQPPSIKPLLGAPPEVSQPIDFQDSFVSDAGYGNYLLDTSEKPVKMTINKTKSKKKLTKNSKMERLNGLFYFNGRPEKIYILPVDG